MNKFVVTCLEAQFHVFDARTQHPGKVSAVVRSGRSKQPRSQLCRAASASA
jgi:hypothetical protein